MPHVDPQRILFIDAYDSFTNNIVSLLETRLQVDVTVIRIDDPINDFASFIRPFAAVVAGPGPGDPRNATDVGLFRELWRLEGEDIRPVLGICLGFQSLVHAFGGTVERLPEPRHGIIRKVRFNGDNDFACLQEVETVQYHSLHASLKHGDAKADIDYWKPSSACPELQPLAWDYDSDNKPDAISDILSPNPQRVLMAVRYVRLPLYGVQFHAESICSSEEARRVIDAWWAGTRAWTRPSWHAGSMKNSHRVVSSSFVDENIRAPEKSKPSKYPRTDQNAKSVLQAIDGNAGKRKARSRDRKDASTGETCAFNAPYPQRIQKVHVDTRILDVGEWTIPFICEALHLTDGDSVILDSEPHQRPEVGEYSILGFVLPESIRFEHTAGSSNLRRTSDCRTSNLDLEHYPGGIFSYLKDFLKQYRPQNQNVKIPFWGGLVGYIGYEACLEMIGINDRPDSGQRNFQRKPDLNFVFIERSIVIDHFKRKMYIQSIKLNDHEWFDETTSRLTRPSKFSLTSSSVNLGPKAASPYSLVQIADERTYKSQVRACQDSIRAGDSYELCLTTQATIKSRLRHDPWPLYRRLRNLNPSPFSAYVRLGNLTLLSSSPERFLCWSRPERTTTQAGFNSDKKTSTCQFRPIKGTVKRQPDPNLPPLTLAQATALLSTPKERAENLMIVDLIRHDLHGVVGSGNVTVPKLMVVEEYATLFQLVSVIEGTLTITDDDCDDDEDDDLINTLQQAPNEPDTTTSPTSPPLPSSALSPSPISILASSLPPGSMTGAPKLRSCQLLRSLESRNRGVYSGVLGYMDIGGGGDFSVVIRSVVRWDRQASDPGGDDAVEGQADGHEQGYWKGEEGDNDDDDDDNEGEEWTIGAGGAVTSLSTEEGEWEEMVAKLKSTLRLFTE